MPVAKYVTGIVFFEQNSDIVKIAYNEWFLEVIAFNIR